LRNRIISEKLLREGSGGEFFRAEFLPAQVNLCNRLFHGTFQNFFLGHYNHPDSLITQFDRFLT